MARVKHGPWWSPELEFETVRAAVMSALLIYGDLVGISIGTNTDASGDGFVLEEPDRAVLHVRGVSGQVFQIQVERML